MTSLLEDDFATRIWPTFTKARHDNRLAPRITKATLLRKRSCQLVGDQKMPSTPLPHIPEQYRLASEILDLVSDKWTVPVMMYLSGQTMRFSVLRRQVTGISAKMLASTLQGLERNGLVRRTIFPVIPPWVEYELTEFGNAAVEPFVALCKVTDEYTDHILMTRLAFDTGG